MKIAVLGLGFMGSTHLRVLQNIPDAEVVAVASEDPVALSGDLSGIQGNLGTSFEKLDFSAYRKYTSFAGAIQDPDAEAVDLCLPTHLHAEAAIAALRAGKHVLVEKPMGLSGAETSAMIAEARNSGKILMTAQVLRFFPEYMALSEVVKNGMLGDVRSAIFRRRCAAPGWGGWLTNPALSGGGVFDLLIHDVDQCLHLFGAPEAVSATGHEDLAKGIDAITAQLHYRDVDSVTVTGGWHHPKKYPFSMEYTVVCDGGTLDYSSAGRRPSLYSADGTESALPLAKCEGYAAEVAYFVQCCVNETQPELCPPEESAAAVELTQLLLKAREMRGEQIPCSLSQEI